MDSRHLFADGDAAARRDAERRSGSTRRLSETDRFRGPAVGRRVYRDLRKMAAVQIDGSAAAVAFLFKRKAETAAVTRLLGPERAHGLPVVFLRVICYFSFDDKDPRRRVRRQQIRW